MARQFEHVVCVARLGAGRTQMLRKVFRRKERFAVAVAADYIRSMMRHPFPEEARNVVIALLTGQLIIASRANGLRDLCVCVHPVERVLAARKRVEDPLMIKLSRDAQVLLVAGYSVEVRQHLFHSAEFGVERTLLLLISQPVNPE